MLANSLIRQRNQMRPSVKLTIVLTFLCCMLNVTITAQAAGPAVRFEPLSIAQGLSHNTVTSILQDSKGFMWFGTRDGLNRYDGYEFKVFRNATKDPRSISDNFIWSVFEDSQGVIWVGTGVGGLNRYNAQTESFSHFRHQPEQSDSLSSGSLSSDSVRSIFEDSDGILWIGTNDGGLNQFDRASQRFVSWRFEQGNPNSLSNDSVYSIIEDSQGDLWIGTDKGLNRYDKKQQHFERFLHDKSQPQSLSHDRIRSVFEDAGGTLWIATYGGGLNQYDRQRGGFKHFRHDESDPNSLSNDFVHAIAQGADGQLWVGTWGAGLNQYDSTTDQFVSLRHSASNPNSISSDLIYTLYGGQSNNLFWIGTSGGGINLFDGQIGRFEHYRQQGADSNSLSDNNVRSILKDSKGTVWVGTRSQGLNRYDRQKKQFVHYRFDATDPNSLSAGPVYTLFEDSDGGIWVGTADGLNRYDPRFDHFIHYRHNPADPSSLSDNRVKAIAQDASGALWIATSGGGLNRFDRSNGTFKVFRHDASDPHSLSKDIVMTVYVDRSDTLWIGTLGAGLNRYDADSGEFVQYKHQQGQPNSLSHDWVFAIHEDGKGNLWVGTSAGLNKFNADKQQFSHYRQEDGLADDTVFSILEDDKGLLWLSSNKGLTRFNPLTGNSRRYDVKDGLQGNEFSLGAAYQSADGELFFGGINGFNRFYAKNITDDNQSNAVTLTDFLLSNQSVALGPGLSSTTAGFTLAKAIDQLDDIELTHKQGMISLQFSALDFANPMKNQYAYQLQGWDEDWVYTDAKRRLATYTKLDPGNYVFQVKAGNKDGVWHNSVKSIQIKVLPPWWKTWQAYLLYIMAIGGSIYAVYRYRTQALVQRANELEKNVIQRTLTINQLMSQKQRMFANVSHEFKTPLTLILNPLESISQQQDKDDFGRKVSMMKRNGQRLLRMVDQLLELSKLETPAVDQRLHYSLAETMNRLLTSFQPLFDSKNLTLHHQPFADVVLFLTVDSLEMIFNNLISNAIKYTPANGEVTITVNTEGANVVVALSDNGIGISADNQQIVFNRFTRANESHDESIPGAGIGLALVKDLVEANQGKITLASEENHGSTFTVTLPLSDVQDVAVTQTSGLSTASLVEVDAVVPLPSIATDSIAAFALGSEHSKPTLLLIDDNPDMLELLKDTLAAHYHCITAHNGELGLSMATEQLPDLVISDVMMPGISGFEVLRQLKLNELTNYIPVVLLTAKGDVQSRIKGWAEKADEYLEKPFNGEELLMRIESLLSVRALLRHRYHRTFSAELEQTGGSANSVESKVTKPTKPTKPIKPTEPTKPFESEPAAEVESANDISAVNQAFIDHINAVLEKHYNDETLDVTFLASEMAMSPRQLARKMRSLVDFTPAESIRSFRLKKAVALLDQGVLPGVVAHQVGFTSHSYFSRCFKAQYDCMPSSYKE
ncbi:MAG: ligand-binding sensor domain-containing protein/signal transduction histidine kinase [Phenylobacterium sp.]|jgi:ligand-binding sensor domain-containing protein/signal transduction histidine kinase/DNA-binding response OmpR family regulator/AraC-like DNA-binding protein